MPTENICPRCGEKGVLTESHADLYMYKGKGDTKMRGVSDGSLCVPCQAKITEGWKYPLDFKVMKSKNYNRN